MHLYKAIWIAVILKRRLYFKVYKDTMTGKGEILLEENIGIIGAGRLGKSLARHFPSEINVYICDKDLSAASS